ncbi:MAG: hypothetical protein HY390_05660 [Deltaproteobacteria bacterium]|nr:hypothetical protein [Deltaproteobacteria bacterium]
MPIDKAIRKTREYLASPEALNGMERNPYWPKWDSPRWHMLLLHKMDLTKEIPELNESME